MSEGQVADVGNAGAAGAMPPMESGATDSLIASLAPGQAPAPSPDSADGMLAKAVQDGDRPEYIPEKFWDPDRKAPKVEDLGKSYINLEKLVSRDKVVMPTGDDDEEGWERVAQAFRPEAPEKYDFGDRPQLPPDLPYDEDAENSYRNWAYANGLSPRQAKRLYEGFVKQQVERHAQFVSRRNEERKVAVHALQREMGETYDARMGRIGRMKDRYGDPDFTNFLNETGIGNDPRMVRFLDRIGQDMEGHTRLQGRPEAQAKPQDIQQAISAFNSKHEKALFDKSHPDHDRLVAERSKLFEALYPDSAA